MKECSSLSLLCPLQSYDRHTDYVSCIQGVFCTCTYVIVSVADFTVRFPHAGAEDTQVFELLYRDGGGCCLV